ncbi:MAG: hypothetical protein WC777_06290 [Candidatus Gracilibacteria bacterium]|jgi:hypothetical protein
MAPKGRANQAPDSDEDFVGAFRVPPIQDPDQWRNWQDQNADQIRAGIAGVKARLKGEFTAWQRQLWSAPPPDPDFEKMAFDGASQLPQEERDRQANIPPEATARVRAFWEENHERLLAEQDALDQEEDD